MVKLRKYLINNKELTIIKKPAPKFNFSSMNNEDAENFFDQLGS